MSKPLAFWQEKYPQAFCWSFGDSPEMADELASLVIAGKKRATCGSFASYQAEERPVTPGAVHIVLNGAGEAVCVIRTLSLRLIRFNEMSAELAALEGGRRSQSGVLAAGSSGIFCPGRQLVARYGAGL